MKLNLLRFCLKYGIPPTILVVITILLNCASQEVAMKYQYIESQHDFILTSYLFPDTLFLYFNSPDDIVDHVKTGNLTEKVGSAIDTLDFRVSKFSSESPRSFLLIHDCSGSMKPYAEKVLCCMENFILNSTPEDEFRIIQLGGKLKKMKNFTRDKNSVIQWLTASNIPTPNGTPLFDALQLGIDYLGSKRTSKTLILFTDGNVASTQNYEYLINWAREVDIRIFVVGYGSIKPGLLSELAKNTNGIFLGDDNPNCQEVAISLKNWVLNYYKVSYTPSKKMLDGQTHFVNFSVPLTSMNYQGKYKVPRDESILARVEFTEQNEVKALKNSDFILPEILKQPIIIPFYDLGNTTLYPSAKQKLDHIILNLLSIPSQYLVTLYIEGYTCDVGSEISNLLLSADRAEAVNNYITAKIPSNIITEMDFFGEANPLVKNANPAEKALNRRVTILVKIDSEQNASINE